MRYWGSSTTCIGDVPVHHPSPIKRRGSPTTHRPSWIIYHPLRTHNPSPIVQLFIVYHPSSNICHACMMHHPWFIIHHQPYQHAPSSGNRTQQKKNDHERLRLRSRFSQATAATCCSRETAFPWVGQRAPPLAPPLAPAEPNRHASGVRVTASRHPLPFQPCRASHPQEETLGSRGPSTSRPAKGLVVTIYRVLYHSDP